MRKFLKALSFKDYHVRFLIEKAKSKLIKPIRLKKEKHQRAVEELDELNKKIYQLEERLMNNEIESSTYQPGLRNLKSTKPF